MGVIFIHFSVFFREAENVFFLFLKIKKSLYNLINNQVIELLNI